MIAAFFKSNQRIWALILRYWYILVGSWPRLIEFIYWPIIQVLLWGYISQYLVQSGSFFQNVVGMLLSAVLLWDILLRSQVGLSISFLEEIWSRNIGNLLISPVRKWEWATALMLNSFLRALIAFIPAALIAIPLYYYNIFTMGLPLMAFFFHMLVMGWSTGFLVNALILRFGQGVQSLAWLAIYIIAPISAIYYPVDVLPKSVQVISYLLPTTYVFEGMRQVIAGDGFNMDYFIKAFWLNGVLFAFSLFVFFRVIQQARNRGVLLQIGE
jgi:ABC-2 type transport system permease protein